MGKSNTGQRYAGALTAKELRRRGPQLALGLFLVGAGLAPMVEARLGLGPWEVLHQGISGRIGIPIGITGILVGIPVLLAWIPLRQRPGIGTVINVATVGLVIDATIFALPTPSSLVLRVAFLAAGVVLIGVGAGIYIGAGLGAGPRDGLMTGIAARGHPIWAVRTVMEVSVLVAGVALGGTAGVGTVLFAFAIGPLVQLSIGRFHLGHEPLTLTAPAE